ncbi:MAG TPA: hypothetical protein PKI99_00685 [Terrimesophilobacter sp.]|nr:hypothetical protein [Terrimesophilobacter sp.]
MTYSTSNPPFLVSEGIGGVGSEWKYVSTDAIATVDGTDYFTNASDLGMATGDLVTVVNTTDGLTTICQVTVDSDGNGTVTALTAVP